MAIETPYGKPALTSGNPAETQRRPRSESSETTGQWLFPPVQHPPQSLNGQLMLSSGALHRGGWEIGWAQIVGMRHRLSEDSMGLAWVGADVQPDTRSPVEQDAIALVLADGVGGGARGDVASHALVQHCLGLPHPAVDHSGPSHLLSGLCLADTAVNKSLATITTMPGAATLAAAWLDASGRGWVSRVGDARLSVLHAATGQWLPVMADQNYANLGETPPAPEHLHAPARMVGAGLMGPPELVPFALQTNEVLMLSSDGLHEWLGDRFASPQPSAPGMRLGDWARMLAMQARENGSDDDISVLLARKTPH